MVLHPVQQPGSGRNRPSALSLVGVQPTVHPLLSDAKLANNNANICYISIQQTYVGEIIISPKVSLLFCEKTPFLPWLQFNL